MTSRDHATPAQSESRLRFGAGEREHDDGPPSGPSLPERLAAARERKGVDLLRAERDTKIRVRYLSALERGDYRDLPGAVYTKGFLRNYAIYLGLDPEDVLRQWRRERGDQVAPAPVVVPPPALPEPSRPMSFSPSIVVAALMTVGVIVFGIYLASQLLRYSRPPELDVTNPAQAVLEVDEGTTSYRLSGTATAGATVNVTVAGREEPFRVTALPSGEWTLQVDLRRGQNRFEIDAVDPSTGKRSEVTRTIVISVPFPEILAPTLTVANPVDGTTYENGAIPVEGTAANASTVTISTFYLGAVGASPAPLPTPAPEPSPGASPGASQPPDGTTVEVDENGAFSLPVELTAGQWAITVTATGEQGKTASLTRHVTVAYRGVNLVVSIKGGSAWIKIWIDGQLFGPQSGRVYTSGKTLTLTGKKSIEIRTGSSGQTFFTLNGVSLGSLGKSGVPETWLFEPPADPVKTFRT
jgi:cytoskeletal protein RodZ